MSLVPGENCAWPGGMFIPDRAWNKRIRELPKAKVSVTQSSIQSIRKGHSPHGWNHQERLPRMAAFRRELYRWQGKMPFQAGDRHQHGEWGLKEKAVVELKLQKGPQSHPPVSKENGSETLPVL